MSNGFCLTHGAYTGEVCRTCRRHGGDTQRKDAPVTGSEMPIVKPTNPKDAVGVAKPPLSTVSIPVIAEVGVAMMEGARKYGRHNYRTIGVRASIYFDAAFRHLGKFWEGEDIDPDSGISHVTKAITSLVVLRDAMIQGKLTDDRPPKSPPGFFAELEAQCKAVIAKYPDCKEAFTEVNKK